MFQEPSLATRNQLTAIRCEDKFKFLIKAMMTGTQLPRTTRTGLPKDLKCGNQTTMGLKPDFSTLIIV